MVPTQKPPTTTGKTASPGTAQPRPLTAAEEALTKDGTMAARPTEPPPISGTVREAVAGAQAVGAEAAGVTAWHIGRHVVALWAINQNRNAWMGTDDVGWCKLANNSDTAVVALTMLASHARDAGGPINYRIETSDGMVHEMYVW